MSLVLAHQCEFVWAIEQDPRAVEYAYINASLNNIKNVSFLVQDVRKALFLNKSAWKNNIDVVIVNPPRSGISKKVIKRIKEILPKKIIYSSCNPKTFSQDVRSLLDLYTIKVMQPFDFFPHTPHVEVLSLLLRK